MEALISAKEAARQLGITATRVRQFIREGRITAVKLEGKWLMNSRELERVADRKTGRPRREDGNQSP